MRLLIDAVSGDWIARGLLWTTNRPSIFVATALVGNNVANFIASVGMIMAARLLYPENIQTAEVLFPLLVAPVVFIYGESLPKRLFFEAPNRLLRACAPGLLVAAVLFAPITAILWLFNRFLQLVVRQSPQVIEAVLARRELEDVLAEGHEAGIVNPAQQTLVQATFALGGQPVRNFVVAPGRYAPANINMTRNDVIRLARRQRRELIPVEEPGGRRQLLGYVRVVDLELSDSPEMPPLQPLERIDADETFLATLMRLQELDQALGHVVDRSGKTVGFVTARMLAEALLRGDSLSV
jgi:CBS domain containing-hemolysin-like protein